MQLGGQASYAVDITSPDELVEAIAWAEQKKLPVIMVGGGSNIVWRDEGFAGLLLVNKIKRFEATYEDDQSAKVIIGAGENWDSVVERCVNLGLSGIEQLSLIPGTAGATPVQNVGAYGRELSEVLISVEAYDTEIKQLIKLKNEDCQFSYRSSRFKTTDKGRFFITSVTLRLTKSLNKSKDYAALSNYFDQHHIVDINPSSIRLAVIAIRQAKLPDPTKNPNCGSFFTNPIIDQEKLTSLIKDYPDIKYWETSNNQIKVAAGWLTENAGLKGYSDESTGLSIWPKQSLVVVNDHAKSTADLIKFKQHVVDLIEAKYGIILNQEPELLPTN